MESPVSPRRKLRLREARGGVQICVGARGLPIAQEEMREEEGKKEEDEKRRTEKDRAPAAEAAAEGGDPRGLAQTLLLRSSPSLWCSSSIDGGTAAP